MDCKLPSSPVHEISQARILEYISTFFSRGSSWLRDWTWVSCIVRMILLQLSHMEALSCKFPIIKTVQAEMNQEYCRADLCIWLNWWSPTLEFNGQAGVKVLPKRGRQLPFTFCFTDRCWYIIEWYTWCIRLNLKSAFTSYSSLGRFHNLPCLSFSHVKQSYQSNHFIVLLWRLN